MEVLRARGKLPPEPKEPERTRDDILKEKLAKKEEKRKEKEE